jgi:hypothetical protein
MKPSITLCLTIESEFQKLIKSAFIILNLITRSYQKADLKKLNLHRNVCDTTVGPKTYCSALTFSKLGLDLIYADSTPFSAVQNLLQVYVPAVSSPP